MQFNRSFEPHRTKQMFWEPRTNTKFMAQKTNKKIEEKFQSSPQSTHNNFPFPEIQNKNRISCRQPTSVGA